MTRHLLAFYGGALLFVGAFFCYAYVVRGTLWAIPVVVVALGALVIMTVAHTKDLYGEATTDRVLKVAFYTIGFNIIGSVLFGLGSAIARSMR